MGSDDNLRCQEAHIFRFDFGSLSIEIQIDALDSLLHEKSNGAFLDELVERAHELIAPS